MAKKLTDDMLKWTLEIDGKPAQKALGVLEQKTNALQKANKGLSVEMQKLKARGEENGTEFKQLEAQYKANNKTINQSKATMKELREEVGLTGLSAKQLRSNMKSLKAQLDNTTPDTPEWTRLNNELKVTSKRFDQVKAGGKKVNGVFGSLKQMIPTLGFAALATGVYQGFKRMISGSVETRSEFSKYEAMLENSLGSHKLATEEFAKLQQFAADTPFQLNELTNSYVKLSNYGLKPGMEDMRKYGDVAASLGKSFDQYVEAIADATQFEFERLKEFGIRASKQGDKVKFTFKGITTEVDAEAKAVQGYLASLGDMAGVAGGMEKISKTIGGALSNTADASDRLNNAIGKRLEPTMIESISNWTKLKNKVADYISLKPSEEIEKEQDSLNVLVKSITSVSDNQKLRNDLIAELQREYPSFLSNLDAEKVTNEQLLTALKDANKEYLKRIKMAVVEEDLTKVTKDQFEVQKKLRETVKNINKDYEGLVKTKKENATLDEKLAAIANTTRTVQTGAAGALAVSNRDIVKLYKQTYDGLLKNQEEYQKQRNELLSEKSDLGDSIPESGTDGPIKVADAPQAPKMLNIEDDDDDMTEADGIINEYLKANETQINKYLEARKELASIQKEFGLDRDGDQYAEAMTQLEDFHDQKLISEEEYLAAKQGIEDAYNIMDLEADVLAAETDQEKWDAQFELAEERYALEFEQAEGNRSLELQAKKKHEKAIEKIDADVLKTKVKKLESEKAIYDAKTNVANTALAALTTIAGKETAIGKIAFLAQQAFAIGQVWFNTQVANAKAVAASFATLGQPWVGINTAQAIASTALIAAQTITGLESGGYANVNRAQDNKEFRAKLDPKRRGYIDKTSLLVSENGGEFVGNAAAVQNSSIRPFFDVIDQAQQNGTISTLNLPEVMGSMGYATQSKESGGYTQNASSDMELQDTDNSNASMLSVIGKMNTSIDKLNTTLSSPILAQMSIFDMQDKLDEVKKIKTRS